MSPGDHFLGDALDVSPISSISTFSNIPDLRFDFQHLKHHLTCGLATKPPSIELKYDFMACAIRYILQTHLRQIHRNVILIYAVRTCSLLALCVTHAHLFSYMIEFLKINTYKPSGDEYCYLYRGIQVSEFLIPV